MATNPEPTELYLPPSFPYPIKVVSIDTTAGADVQRGTRLLTYSFVHAPPQRDAQLETRFGTWDCAIEGKIASWNVAPGDVVAAPKARQRPVVVVLEECKHGMQIGGMCVVCGKDMTVADYLGFDDSSRANIQMNHSVDGPTVSLEEAERIERENIEELLQARKLTLIVDLDQTVVHATVDPTVGEWKAEGAAWKARHETGDADDPADTCNPNWEALEDVAEFKLKSEMPGGGRGRMPEPEGPTYYIKRRPGWEPFLRDMSTKYQMHVYTMGTRAYAEEVCALIDPKGDIFGRRLLSRDESNSMTRKSLERLFPCDTSMVVVIDDRADVWEWTANLLKVVPYDFFIGIGDINGTFLPKNTMLGPTTEKDPPPPIATAKLAPGGDPTPVAEATAASAARAEQTEKALIKQNTIALEAQVEERPLAKKQEELQEEVKAAETEDVAMPEKSPPPQALLKNDDNELDRIRKLLEEVHDEFYALYETSSKENKASPPTNNRRRNSIKAKHPYDVTEIILRKRSRVLAGTHIVFSGVIPLDTDPQISEHWRLARMFGARCSTDLHPDVTHVVCAKPGTVKADAAMRRGGIHVVRADWFTDCLGLLARQDETLYPLEGMRTTMGTKPSASAPTAKPSTSILPSASTSAVLVDEDEIELDAPVASTGSLALDTINWDDINDEVDAAMNESDDDEDEGAGAGRDDRSAMSEEDWTDREDISVQTNSAPGTPSRGRRKRLRSVTPSDAANGSPLSKRTKMLPESKLKEEVKLGPSAASGENGKMAVLPPITTDGIARARAESPYGSPRSRASVGDDDEGDEDEDDDAFDFLAGELEEEADFLAGALEEEAG
ncbi:RNA polymerase II subunit A C-terminal domain phosphatase [Mycena kentingensis (nom. inval.)]|nr:RNA polymerase II subunit A C-terminal domain phosphatase [Mycena kentingensis (nom. inval.)]